MDNTVFYATGLARPTPQRWQERKNSKWRATATHCHSRGAILWKRYLHHSMVDFQNSSSVFYHGGDIFGQTKSPFNSSLCIISFSQEANIVGKGSVYKTCPEKVSEIMKAAIFSMKNLEGVLLSFTLVIFTL